MVSVTSVKDYMIDEDYDPVGPIDQSILIQALSNPSNQPIQQDSQRKDNTMEIK